jgi:predicted DNA-binding transcriptional regulator AlpA
MTIDDLIPKSKVIEIVAKVMNLSERHVGDRILKKGDFPKPKRQSGRTCVYAKQDIEKWLGVK